MLKDTTKIEKLKSKIVVKPPRSDEERGKEISDFLAELHDPNVLGHTMKGLSE